MYDINTISKDSRQLSSDRITNLFSEMVQKLYSLMNNDIKDDEGLIIELISKIESLLIPIISERKIDLIGEKERATFVIFSPKKSLDFDINFEVFFNTLLLIYSLPRRTKHEINFYKLVERVHHYLPSNESEILEIIEQTYKIDDKLGFIIIEIAKNFSLTLRSQLLHIILDIVFVTDWDRWWNYSEPPSDTLRSYLADIPDSLLSAFIEQFQNRLIQTFLDRNSEILEDLCRVLTKVLINPKIHLQYPEFIMKFLAEVKQNLTEIFTTNELREGFLDLIEKLTEFDRVPDDLILTLREIDEKWIDIVPDNLVEILDHSLDPIPPPVNKQIWKYIRDFNNVNTVKRWIFAGLSTSGQLQSHLRAHPILKHYIECSTINEFNWEKTVHLKGITHRNQQSYDPYLFHQFSHNLILFSITLNDPYSLNFALKMNTHLPPEIQRILIVFSSKNDGLNNELEANDYSKELNCSAVYACDLQDSNSKDKLLERIYLTISPHFSMIQSLHERFPDQDKFNLVCCDSCQSVLYYLSSPYEYAVTPKGIDITRSMNEWGDVREISSDWASIFDDYWRASNDTFDIFFLYNGRSVWSDSHPKDLMPNGYACNECLINVYEKGTPFEYREGHRHFGIRVNPSGLYYIVNSGETPWTVLLGAAHGYPFLRWMLQYYFHYDKLAEKDTFPFPRWSLLQYDLTQITQDCAILQNIFDQFDRVAREFDLSLIRIGKKTSNKIVFIIKREDTPIFEFVGEHMKESPTSVLDLHLIVPLIDGNSDSMSLSELAIEKKILDYLRENVKGATPPRIAKHLLLPLDIVQNFLDKLVRKYLINYIDPVGDSNILFDLSKSAWTYNVRKEKTLNNTWKK